MTWAAQAWKEVTLVFSFILCHFIKWLGHKLLEDKCHLWGIVCASSVMSDSLRPRGLQPFRFLCPQVLQARILGWVAMPSSRGSSQPRDWTCISCISCIVGEFFTTEPLGKLLRLWEGSYFLVYRPRQKKSFLFFFWLCWIFSVVCRLL